MDSSDKQGSVVYSHNCIDQDQGKSIGTKHLLAGGTAQIYDPPRTTNPQTFRRPEFVQDEWAVDTYQIAVRNGDCSIHLLVQRPASRTDGHRGRIVRSILMDGGNDGYGHRSAQTAPTVQSCIKKIAENYRDVKGQTYSDKNPLKFTSWVITHWDADHWKGTMEMIIQDLYKSHTSSFLAENAILYCPNWTEVPEHYDREPKHPGKATSKPGFLHLKGLEENGQGEVYVELKDKDPKRLCCVIFGPANLLGLDFFTGEICHGLIDPELRGQLSHKKALSQLYSLEALSSLMSIQNQNEDEKSRRPRLYCAAAGGLVLGKDGFSESEINLAYLQIVENGLTWVNLSSIISVLYFCGAEHVSLYWGGDAVEHTERSLAEGKFFGDLKVTVAKWSHHGSQHSNPAELFEKIQPKRCIVSAGVCHTYTHPHPDVVRRFISYLKKINAGDWGTRLYASQFPEYMLEGKQKEGKNSSPELNEEEEFWGRICPIQRKYIWDIINLWNPYQEVFEVRDGSKILSDVSDPIRVLYTLIESSSDQNRDGEIEIFAARSSEWSADRIKSIMPSATSQLFNRYEQINQAERQRYCFNPILEQYNKYQMSMIPGQGMSKGDSRLDSMRQQAIGIDKGESNMGGYLIPHGTVRGVNTGGYEHHNRLDEEPNEDDKFTSDDSFLHDSPNAMLVGGFNPDHAKRVFGNQSLDNQIDPFKRLDPRYGFNDPQSIFGHPFNDSPQRASHIPPTRQADFFTSYKNVQYQSRPDLTSFLSSIGKPHRHIQEPLFGSVKQDRAMDLEPDYG